MKTYLSIGAVAVCTVLGFVLHYTFVVIPEQRDRQQMKEAMTAIIEGDMGEARATMTGRANSYFEQAAIEIEKRQATSRSRSP
jgi:preprotein translocase subunit YajC